MGEKIKQHRILAVQRFKNGESPASICTSLGKSKVWLYKWTKRYSGEESSWCEDLSRRPLATPLHTPAEVEEIVKMVRLNLYNQNLFCGAQAIYWELEEIGVKPLPSIRTINRILSRNDLTYRRTGKYEAKGTVYPKLPSLLPNQTHQADLVGPCYLKGPVRFYSLNVVDTATARCGLYPSPSKSGQRKRLTNSSFPSFSFGVCFPTMKNLDHWEAEDDQSGTTYPLAGHHRGPDVKRRERCRLLSRASDQ